MTSAAFAAELDAASLRLWNENWHLLAHRSELANAYDYVRFEVLGREVVLHHDGASVVAFDNRCPHRGARIFDGDRGRERFLCRYHGWSYAKGRIFVADREALSHCPLDNLSLATLQMEWLGDFAFVSPAPEQSLDAQLAGLAPLVEALSQSVGGCFDFNRYAYEADWRIALENALEPYHIGPIHPDTLNKMKLEAGTNTFYGRNSVWSAPLGDARMARQLKGLGRLFDLAETYDGYRSLYLFPFSMISATYGLSQSLQTFLPSSTPERTHFTSRLFTGRLQASTKAELVNPFMTSSAALNRQVFEEDHDICRRMPVASWSSDEPRFWSKAEEKLVHFRASYRDALSAR